MRPLTDAEREEIRARIIRGEFAPGIALAMGRGVSTIRTEARSMGLVLQKAPDGIAQARAAKGKVKPVNMTAQPSLRDHYTGLMKQYNWRGGHGA